MAEPQHPLSILAIAPYLPFPPDHGGRIRTFLLLRELARRGHRVALVVLAGDEDRDRDADGLRDAGIEVTVVPHERRFGQLAMGDRVRKLRHLIAGRSDVLARYRSDEAVAAAAALGVFDVVVAEALWTAPLALALDARAHVLNAHNVESMIAARIASSTAGAARSFAARREASGLRRDEARFGARFDGVAVVSEDDRRAFRELAPGVDVTVVGNCVDTDQLKPLPAPEGGPPRCLFIGTPAYAPNHDAVSWFLQEVFPRVLERHPDARFDVVGADPPEAWRELAAQTPGVSLLGYVEDVVEVYRSATVVVVPIRVGGGTRLKILEALALGRPVVTTTIGGEGLGLEHQRTALVADAPAAFADAVLGVHADAALAESLASAGRQHVEQAGSASAMGDAFERVIVAAHARAGGGG